jgi:hypothetical protein
MSQRGSQSTSVRRSSKRSSGRPGHDGGSQREISVSIGAYEPGAQARADELIWRRETCSEMAIAVRTVRSDHDNGDGQSAVAPNASDTRCAHDSGERADEPLSSERADPVVPLPGALLSLSPLKPAARSRPPR